MATGCKRKHLMFLVVKPAEQIDYLPKTVFQMGTFCKSRKIPNSSMHENMLVLEGKVVG